MKINKEYQDLITALNEFVMGLDERVRESAFNFLLRHTTGALTEQERPTIPTDSAAANQKRDLSPQELIRQTKATSATAKAEVLAYWLETNQGKQSFSSADIKDAFSLAREPAPKNPSDVVARLASAGKLMPSEKVGTVQNYRLTRTAIEEVEAWGRAD